MLLLHSLMATYLLASLTKSLFDPKYIPVGIIAQEGEEKEVRVVPEQNIPDKYKPEGDLSRLMLQNLEAVLQTVEKCSGQPTNLYFTMLEQPAPEGSLVEQADRLFKELVLPHYRQH